MSVLGVTMSPMVYVIVFVLAFYRSISEVGGPITSSDFSAACGMGVRYCVVAWLLGWCIPAV